MKYLEVRPINIARDDHFRAVAYPGDGVYMPSTGIGLVVVLAGHVWRGPDGAVRLVREAANEKGVAGVFGTAAETAGMQTPLDISMRPALVSEGGQITDVRIATREEVNARYKNDPPPYSTPYEETVLVEDLRRWAIEQSVKVAAEGEHWSVVEARAKAMVEWVRKPAEAIGGE